MTTQEVFDKVATHLLTQNCKSVDDFGRCFYRGPEGTKCAVGILIPDEQYNPSMEHHTVQTLIDKFPMPEYFNRDKIMLIALQRIHDSDLVSTWKLQLEIVSVVYNLEMPIVL